MGIKIASLDENEYKIKNKKPLLVFIIVSFLLVLPIIASSLLGIKYFTGEQKSFLDYYLEFLFTLVLLMIPGGFLIYGVYAFFKKEIFIRFGIIDFKIIGGIVQLLAIPLIFIGLVGLTGLCYIFFFYGR